MDYFKDAFGGFDPHLDADAALKFSLDGIFADDRLEDLVALVSADSEIDGLEGEPGWIIEKRGGAQTQGDETWPSNAYFRSFVDPDSYRLSHPEFFCDRATFISYIIAIADVFSSRNPNFTSRVTEIKHLLSEA